MKRRLRGKQPPPPLKKPCVSPLYEYSLNEVLQHIWLFVLYQNRVLVQEGTFVACGQNAKTYVRMQKHAETF